MTEDARRRFLSMRVLPAMDARAEADWVRSAGYLSDEEDVRLMKEYIAKGAFKASGIHAYDGERVGTFFYSLVEEVPGEKTFFILGVGAEGRESDGSLYRGIMDAAYELAKREGCVRMRAGSSRPGAIREMLAWGAVPVRVEFVKELD